MCHQKIVIDNCMGIWNVSTAEGYVMASFRNKIAARLYQRIAARTRLTDGKVYRAVCRRLGSQAV